MGTTKTPLGAHRQELSAHHQIRFYSHSHPMPLKELRSGASQRPRLLRGRVSHALGALAGFLGFVHFDGLQARGGEARAVVFLGRRPPPLKMLACSAPHHPRYCAGASHSSWGSGRHFEFYAL